MTYHELLLKRVIYSTHNGVMTGQHDQINREQV